MLRHLLTASLGLICCLRTSAQCSEQKLFPSVYVESFDCDGATLTAVNTANTAISWSADGQLIAGESAQTLNYSGPTDGVTFTLAVIRGDSCGSDSARITATGGCPREICGNGVDDDGDGLTDLLDVEDCSCGVIPPVTDRSLIPNGSFERRRDISPECDGCYIAYWQLDCVEGWEASNPNSSIEHVLKCYANGVGTDFVNYTMGNNASFLAARLAYDSSGFSSQETARVALNAPTIPGERYQFTARMDIAGGSVKDLAVRQQEFILFGSTTGKNFPFRFQGRNTVTFGGKFADWTAIDSFNLEINEKRGWQYVYLEFIAPAEPITHLVLAGKLGTTYAWTEEVPDYTVYYVMDDVDLRRIVPPPTLPEELIAQIDVEKLAADGANPCIRRSLLTTPRFDDYAYQWYRNSIGIPDATAHSYLAEVGADTNDLYRVGVYKDGVCRLSDPVRMDGDAPFSTLLELDSIGCAGAADGRLRATFDPPEVVQRYRLYGTDGSEGMGRITDGTLTLAGLDTGSYTLTVTDEIGCTSEQDFALSQPAPLTLAVEVKPIDCNGSGLGSLAVLYGGGRAPYQLLLNEIPQDSLQATYQLPAGVYRPVLEDSAGCQREAPPVLIEAIRPFDLEAHADPSTVYLGQATHLSYRSNRNLDAADFTWLNLSDTACFTCDRLTTVPLRSDTLRLRVVDTDGCLREAETYVRVLKDARVYFPSAFSPDNDGTNDSFRAYPGRSVAVVLTLEIYDRWGGLVFSGNGEDPSWNGMAVDGTPYAAGTYVYRSRLLLLDGRTVEHAGSVNLIR